MDPLDMTGLLRALAASEAGSFAAAARRLGVSRQAVHRSVEALEAAHGPLFDRDARGLRPTSLGRALLRHAAALREVEQGLRGTLASRGGAPGGLVRVATPPVFGDVVLGAAVQALARAHPAVRFHVRAESRRTDLIIDDYDLMIRVGAAPPAGLYARLLGHAGQVLCAAPAALAALGPIDDPARLSSLPLLEYGPQRSAAWGLSRGGEAVTVDVDPLLCADSAPLVVDACLSGLGVLRAPALLVRAHLRAGRLLPVLPAWALPRAEVWAIYGHRSAADPTLAALLAALQDAFAAEG